MGVKPAIAIHLVELSERCHMVEEWRIPGLAQEKPCGDPSRLRKYLFALVSSLHSTLKNSVWCVEITVFSRLSGLLSSFAR